MTAVLLLAGPPRPAPLLTTLFAVRAGPITATSEPAGGRPSGPFAVDLAAVDVDHLIAEHADAVYRVAFSITRDRHLAQDVTQDALMKAWQKLPTFRGESPLRNWILRITHNTAISALRRRREEVRDPDMLPEHATADSVEAAVRDSMALDDFTEALDGLDDLSRSIVVLREIEGLTYDEISEVLGVPLPTVKTRLLRARKRLATALAEWRP
ncbi:MAG: RNA polymerase sigma factor [Acidimicrobiia bacterium]|nr:RNA polymerase sigma factor [Acidimicrobiia bacterium]